MTFRPSIRLKLTAGILLPLLVAILVCWLAGVYIIRTRVISQAQERVRSDLNTARQVYLNEIAHIHDVVRSTALTPRVSGGAAAGDRAALAAVLVPMLKTEQLDILNVVDAQGRVVFRGANPDASGDTVTGRAFVRSALAGNEVTATASLTEADLAREGAPLSARAAVKLVPTPRAVPTTRDEERSGLFMMAASPLRDPAGRIVGALYGGVLINGNNSIPDRIRRIVYGGRDGDEGKGFATLFLGDVRVATNVPDASGRRAIGTRMSQQVYERVIRDRKPWVDRAFVVREWYYSAYEPLLNVAGEAIGALYVGIPEAPFTAFSRGVNILFVWVLLTASIIGVAMAWFLGDRLTGPIRELDTLVRRFTLGERGLGIGVRSRDEIGDLARRFNEMSRTITESEAEIRSLNLDLERKVRERTAELEEKNLLLLKTQEELVRTAKLAEIGVLAAGVAHEINNPMAIIRGNAELLQMGLPADDPNQEEVETITRQVGRVERIVSGLLTFARQEKMRLQRVPLHALLNDILRQVTHQVSLERIRVVTDFQESISTIAADGDRLRQVFTNLVLNGVQAMKEGGTLTVATRREGETVRVAVSDTGSGIRSEDLERVFTPFFTTRGEGTGLGLSVSYGIVKDHGGNIHVESEPGKGSTFTVSLPAPEE
ncbi:MAG TPA: cache domain-containing protein [Verrucomicrobiae bacterium]|nr:cache domain-containing protein [Verrucomicrobiae bacterium]